MIKGVFMTKKNNKIRTLATTQITFPFEHTPEYTRTTPADGEIFEATFKQYDEAINSLYSNYTNSPSAGVAEIGALSWYIVEVINPDYLLANGQELNRADFPELNTKLQARNYPYGAGNGSTTFRLPNLMGDKKFIRSTKEDTSDLGVLENDQVQGFGLHIDGRQYASGAGQGSGIQPWDKGTQSRVGYMNATQAYDIGYGVPRIGNETRPTNISLLPYIKVK